MYYTVYKVLVQFFVRKVKNNLIILLSNSMKVKIKKKKVNEFGYNEVKFRTIYLIHFYSN